MKLLAYHGVEHDLHTVVTQDVLRQVQDLQIAVKDQ